MSDTPTPLAAAAPITVGELNDVPTPNSPINAQYMQEVANRIVHRFATVAALNGWAAANGSMAFVTATGLHYARRADVWQPLAYAADVAALAARPVTSAMIQDGTIVAADLNASVLSESWQIIGDTGGNWAGESGYYKRVGNTVTFHFQGSCAAAGFTLIYPLPAGYRPNGTLYFDTPGSIGWQITAAGQVAMLTATVAGQVGTVFAFTATYPVP